MKKTLSWMVLVLSILVSYAPAYAVTFPSDTFVGHFQGTYQWNHNGTSGGVNMSGDVTFMLTGHIISQDPLTPDYVSWTSSGTDTNGLLGFSAHFPRTAPVSINPNPYPWFLFANDSMIQVHDEVSGIPHREYCGTEDCIYMSVVPYGRPWNWITNENFLPTSISLNGLYGAGPNMPRYSLSLDISFSDVEAKPVAEPSSLYLLGSAFFGLIAIGRRQISSLVLTRQWIGG